MTIGAHKSAIAAIVKRQKRERALLHCSTYRERAATDNQERYAHLVQAIAGRCDIRATRTLRGAACREHDKSKHVHAVGAAT
jgi:RNase P subunit RPR2